MLLYVDCLNVLQVCIELVWLDVFKDDFNFVYIFVVLLIEVCDQVGCVNCEIIDGYECQVVVIEVVYLFGCVGLWKDSDELLKLVLVCSYLFYYLMSQLGGNVKK